MGESIAVVGAGAWGTALALLLAEKGHQVTIWMYEADLAREMNELRENRVYLPGFSLPPSVIVTSDIAAAVADKAIILSVTPSHTVRAISISFAPFLRPGAIVVNASKGIEIETLKPLSEVFKDTLPYPFRDRTCFLSGPSFAKEVAQKMPTAVTLAAPDAAIGLKVQEIFSSSYLRVYTNKDVIGVELAGSLKNVIAIAAGVLEGLGYGYNTTAGLLTRGLAEMTRLGIAMGGRHETFAGLAGMGDLVLTCTGGLSRNRTLGVRLGRGEKLGEIMAGAKTVAEGVRTAKAARDLAARHAIEMPIVEEVYRLLYEDKDPRAAVRDLMNRDLKNE